MDKLRFLALVEALILTTAGAFFSTKSEKSTATVLAHAADCSPATQTTPTNHRRTFCN